MKQRYHVFLQPWGVYYCEDLTTGKEEPSHVLAAMGLKAAQAVRAVRFSAGWVTNESDWEALVKGVAKVHAEMPHAKI